MGGEEGDKDLTLGGALRDVAAADADADPGEGVGVEVEAEAEEKVSKTGDPRCVGVVER